MTPARRWTFRLLAMLLGIVVVAALELICHLVGWGIPETRDDPFVGFTEVSPLFEENGDRYEIVPSRLKFFAPESFAAEKSEKEFRIFILGGSTVQGRPYSLETTFGTWLELALNSVDRSRNWEVVNCGGLSYASYRLVPILEECFHYEPDLIVLCTAHNEFLEDRSYEHIKPHNIIEELTLNAASRSRLFHLMRSGVDRLRGGVAVETSVPQLKGEVDAILDYNDSLQAYHRDDDWRQSVVEHYEYNLRRMLALCREQDVPVLLIRPPVNLADSPPFKSEPSEALSDLEEEKLLELLATARAHYRDDLSQSVLALEQAVGIDPRFALAWYELGQCYLTRKEKIPARNAFQQALDEDICPLRMVSEIDTALQTVAKQTGTPLIDVYALLESKSRSQILDAEWLADHVHPTIAGHQEIAKHLLEELQREGFLSGDIAGDYDEVWREHFRHLDDHYFHKGLETLKSLQGWAQGRADGPPVTERFPHRISVQGPENSSSPKK